MAFDQKRHDELAKKDVADLSEEESTELALLRSEVSLLDYDPSKIKNESDRVVELPDRSSTTLGELAKDESQPVSVRIDAQSAIDNPPPSSPVAQEEMRANTEASAPGAKPVVVDKSTPSSSDSSSKTSGSSTPSS